MPEQQVTDKISERYFPGRVSVRGAVCMFKRGVGLHGPWVSLLFHGHAERSGSRSLCPYSEVHSPCPC